MPSSIADYEVIGSVPRPPGRRPAHRCRPPERLGVDGDVMLTEVAADGGAWPEVVERLLRMAATADDHLLRLLEAIGPAGGRPGFLVSELPGDGYGARPSLGGALRAVEAAALAAHALHEAGLTHGGIGPDALFDTGRGPVLGPPPLDDPAGTVVDASSWERLVTVDPERLAGEAASRSSDVWALGATLHLLASDRPLYDGIEADPPVTAVQRALFSAPDVDPALPEGVGRLVSDCLARDPGDRPATAADVAARARALAAGPEGGEDR